MKLWFDENAQVWSAEINGTLYCDCSIETIDGLVELAMVKAQRKHARQSKAKSLPRTDNGARIRVN